MSAIPTIWFLLKLLWTHRTHLGNYASCNAGLTCQHTAQGQPGDWPSCDKSALTSSKLIWPGADCRQLIILAIPSSKEVQWRWKTRRRKNQEGEKRCEERKGGEKKKHSLFLSPRSFCWHSSAELNMNSEIFFIYSLQVRIFCEYTVQSCFSDSDIFFVVFNC